MKRGEAIARRLQAGSVCVNDAQTNYAALNLPMGGWKASGVGTRHGASGIRKYTKIQSVMITRYPLNREPFMFPYRPRRTLALRRMPSQRISLTRSHTPSAPRRASSFSRASAAFSRS